MFIVYGKIKPNKQLSPKIARNARIILQKMCHRRLSPVFRFQKNTF
jgi:hypothetical protein